MVEMGREKRRGCLFFILNLDQCITEFQKCQDVSAFL